MSRSRRRWGSITRYGAGWRARAGDESRTTVGTYLDADWGGRDGARDVAEEALDEARRAWVAQHAPKGRGAVLVTYGRALFDRWEREGTRRAIDRERARFERHIATAPFSEDPIASIEHRQVQRWVRRLAATDADGPRGGPGKKRSRGTILNVLNLLRSILRHAIEDEIIDESPARDIVVPRVPKAVEDFRLLEAHEVDAIVAREPDELVSLQQLSAVTVAVFTGMRPGELWGLRWGDVPRLDVAAGGAITVRHNRNRPTKGGRVRHVPLLEPARERLADWCRAEELRRERPARADELVWPGPEGFTYGEGYDAGWADRRQSTEARTYTQLGLRWRLGISRRLPLKDLRHTCACALLRGWWVSRGWVARPLSMQEIAAWLGHQSVTTTEKHYARLAPGGLLDVFPTRKP